MMARNKVVLPAPLRPISPHISPSSSANEALADDGDRSDRYAEIGYLKHGRAPPAGFSLVPLINVWTRGSASVAAGVPSAITVPS